MAIYMQQELYFDEIEERERQRKRQRERERERGGGGGRESALEYLGEWHVIYLLTDALFYRNLDIPLHHSPCL